MTGRSESSGWSGRDARQPNDSIEFELRAAGVSGGRHELHIRLVRLEFTLTRSAGAESVDVSGLLAVAVESAHLTATTNTNESASGIAFVLDTLPSRGVLFLRPRIAGIGDGDGDRASRATRDSSGSIRRPLASADRPTRGGDRANAPGSSGGIQFLVRARSPLGRFTQAEVNEGRLFYRLAAHPSLFLPSTATTPGTSDGTATANAGLVVVDRADFRVHARGGSSDRFTLLFTVRAPPPAAPSDAASEQRNVYLNSRVPLDVLEGGVLLLNETLLAVVNRSDEHSVLDYRFSLTRHPEFGAIQRCTLVHSALRDKGHGP